MQQPAHSTPSSILLFYSIHIRNHQSIYHFAPYFPVHKHSKSPTRKHLTAHKHTPIQTKQKTSVHCRDIRVSAVQRAADLVSPIRRPILLELFSLTSCFTSQVLLCQPRRCDSHLHSPAISTVLLCLLPHKWKSRSRQLDIWLFLLGRRHLVILYHVNRNYQVTIDVSVLFKCDDIICEIELQIHCHELCSLLV